MRLNSAELAAPCPLLEPTLPRRVWRQLLSSPNVPPCARVLVAGPQPLALATWLAELSFDVLATCDNAGAVFEGRRFAPRVDFVRLGADLRFSLPPQSCDIAFIQPLPMHGENWLSLNARLATATLAAALKPGARMVSWQCRGDSQGHADTCWPRHLACFPGRVATATVSNSPLPDWNWRTTRVETLLTTWQLPPEPLTLDEWRNYARRGLLTDRRNCCVPTAAATQTSTTRRAA